MAGSLLCYQTMMVFKKTLKWLMVQTLFLTI